jgi:hypothetical protein
MKKFIFCILASLSSYIVNANNHNFENQLQIELLKESGAYRFQVPPEVYRNVYRSNLDDIRIINSTGDFVPIYVSFSDDIVKFKYTDTSLPLFKLNETVSATTSIPVTTQQVRKTIKGQTESYSVTTSQSLSQFMAVAEVQSNNIFYIDASIIADLDTDSLSFEWHYKTVGNRIFSVNLSGSNDLIHWTVIKTQHKLIEVNTGNKTLLDNKIQLNHKNFAYYQLKFNDVIVPEMTLVKAHLVSQQLTSQMQWQNIENFKLHHDNEIIIDTGGYFPLQAFQIQFNQKNIVTDVKISSGMRNNKWHQTNHANNTLYDITTDGMDFKQDTINVARNNRRFWKLQFDDNVKNKTIKSIKVGWRQHQVEFLAQGNAPFTLLYGNPKIKRRASVKWYYRLPNKNVLFKDQVKLVKSSGLARDNNAIKDRPNAKTDSFMTQAVQAKWLFWMILTLVLLVLSYMAYKLIVGMEQEKDSG